MPKHIRHGVMDVASTTWDNIKEAVNKVTAKKEGFRREEEEEGMNRKHIMLAIIILIIALIVANYMGYIELPSFLSDILPRKAAPASHLQYFFF
jgi:hypothetical protein